MIEQDVDGLSNSLWEGLLRPNIFFFPHALFSFFPFCGKASALSRRAFAAQPAQKPALIQKIKKERHSEIVFAFRIGVIIDSRPDGKHYTAIIPTVDKRP